MSRTSPRRRRAFKLTAGCEPDWTPDRLGPRAQASGQLQVEWTSVHRGVQLHGVYTVHGNSEYDLRQMAERAGLTAVRIETLDVQVDPCGDLRCGGCAKHAAPRMVDSWGLAGGGIILGGVQAGFELVHRVSTGFGNDSVEGNRHLLGDRWETETGDSSDWTPFDGIAYVCGVPPCSGFSLLNTSAAIAKKNPGRAASNFRGAASPINACQRELVVYAAACRGSDGGRGAEVVAFESVQGAFTKGRELMREYLELLRERTGQDYRLYHLLHSGATLGVPQQRHRYFWVAARIPFGVEPVEVTKIATYRDAIEDLERLPIGEDPEAILTLPDSTSDLQRELRGALPNGHVYGVADRYWGILEELARDWEPGEDHVSVFRRYYDRHGKMPDGCSPSWFNPETRLPSGFMGPRRPRYDQPGYVVSGGGPSDFVHPSADRILTLRELARLMTIPDDWSLAYGPARTVGPQIGKNCPTRAGRWVGEWAMRAIQGNPGSVTSYGRRAHEVDDDLEFVFDVSNDWRAVWKRQKEEIAA